MIWLTQVLCPSRHCVVGACWDDTQVTHEFIEQQLDEAFGTGKLNRWCGICGSRDIKTEHAQAPRFKTLEEIADFARFIERKQLESRLLLDVLGLTYDEALRRLTPPN
jgi:hypothetical protein